MSAAADPSKGESGPPALSRWPGVAAGALLALAVVLAYANTLHVPFLLDDRSAIVENTSITDLGNLGAVLTPAKITTSGRPLLNLSFALNHAWGGQSVAGYHVVNAGIHFLAALTLFGVVRRTLRSPRLMERCGDRALPLGFLSALVWAVHPLLTSAVTYLSQRAESLMGLLFLLTIYAFIRSTAAAGSARWAWVSVAACVGGMMTKEVMVTAPVIVLLYDRVFCSASFAAALGRRRWYYAGLALCWVLLGYLIVGTQLGARSVGLRVGDDWLFYAFTQCKVIVGYVRLALVPFPLVFDYGQEILVREFLPIAPYAVLVLAGLAFTGWQFWRGRLALGFAAATFFILLSPSSSMVPVMGQPMAESRMYLPLAALVVLLVVGLDRVWGRAAWYGLGGVALALGVLAGFRNHDYRSALILWEDTIRRVPDNSRGRYNLANELVKIPGRSAEAIAHYEAALRLKPDLAEAHHNLANELAKIPGRAEDALAHYAAALRLQPDLVEAHFNAARLLGQMPGRLPEIIGHLAEAVRLRPESAGAHFQLANELARIPDRAEEAIGHYEAALRLRPDFAEAHNNLANRLARLPGRMPQALEHYEAALRLNPDLVEAHYNYANKLANLPDRLPDAVRHYEAALRLNPQLAEAHKNLALALANLGRLDEAVRHLEAALALRPDYTEARDLLREVQTVRRR